MAFRPGQLAQRAEAVLDAATREPGVVRLDLQPLTRDEAGQLLGPVLHRALHDDLYRLSGGNPFYLESLARVAGPRGTVAAPADSVHVVAAVPVAVQRALSDELAALSPRAHALDPGRRRRWRSVRGRTGGDGRRDGGGRGARGVGRAARRRSGAAESDASPLRISASTRAPRGVRDGAGRLADRCPRQSGGDAGRPERVGRVARPSRRPLRPPRRRCSGGHADRGRGGDGRTGTGGRVWMVRGSAAADAGDLDRRSAPARGADRPRPDLDGDRPSRRQPRRARRGDRARPARRHRAARRTRCPVRRRRAAARSPPRRRRTCASGTGRSARSELARGRGPAHRTQPRRQVCGRAHQHACPCRARPRRRHGLWRPAAASLRRGVAGPRPGRAAADGSR